MHVWALGLSCETPAAPADQGAGARTRQPENSKRAHFMAPALQKPHQKGRGEILGPPPFGAPPFGAPPFGVPHPSGCPTLWGAPPFGVPHPSGPHLSGPHLSGFGPPTLRGPHPSGAPHVFFVPFVIFYFVPNVVFFLSRGVFFCPGPRNKCSIAQPVSDCCKTITAAGFLRRALRKTMTF